MKFWIVSYVDASTDEKFEFTIASDEKQSKEKIIKDLSLAFPGKKEFCLEQGTRPSGWFLFEN